MLTFELQNATDCKILVKHFLTRTSKTKTKVDGDGDGDDEDSRSSKLDAWHPNKAGVPLGTVGNQHLFLRFSCQSFVALCFQVILMRISLIGHVG